MSEKISRDPQRQGGQSELGQGERNQKRAAHTKPVYYVLGTAKIKLVADEPDKSAQQKNNDPCHKEYLKDIYKKMYNERIYFAVFSFQACQRRAAGLAVLTGSLRHMWAYPSGSIKQAY